MKSLRRAAPAVLAVVGACAPGLDPSITVVPTSHVDSGVRRTDVPAATDRGTVIAPTDHGTSIIAEDAACANTTATAARLPVNLLIVLDHSGSMRDGNPSKWSAAVGALRTLLTGLADDVRVGIPVFPATSGDAASAASYARPQVPVAPLSTSRAQVLSLHSSTMPNGNTPMNCALSGTNTYDQGFPLDGSRNVILITDGQPTEECTTASRCGGFPPNPSCAATQAAITTAAVLVTVAQGARGTPPIRTFVAGTPDATDQFLSDLAYTGNTARTADCRSTATCHYRLSTGTFGADLAAALDDIRGRALSCEFAVDVDPARVDPLHVNVDVTPSGAGSPTVVPRDVNHVNGWDYSTGMHSVVLYGPACSQVMSDPGVQVQILFGCPTVTPG